MVLRISPCDLTQVTCGTLNNVQNYMDYASCHYMFTRGTKARMHGYLSLIIPATETIYLHLQI
ncbi:MAG: hypothetical protein IPP34_09225 [Bacteroidetes bacterium]|nr:hypothetical protein [Bacteroidota bacterium]